MGVQINVLFHQEMPFNEMIPKIIEAYKDVNLSLIDPAEQRVPIPFLQRLLMTRAKSVISDAVTNLLTQAADNAIVFRQVDRERLSKMLMMDKLDWVYITTLDMLLEFEEISEPIREVYQTERENLRTFVGYVPSEQANALLASRPVARELAEQPFRKHVYGESRYAFSYRAVTGYPQDADSKTMTLREVVDKYATLLGTTVSQPSDGKMVDDKTGKEFPFTLDGLNDLVKQYVERVPEGEYSFEIPGITEASVPKTPQQEFDEWKEAERRPMTQADLSRIHMTDYVDDGWKREVGPNGPTGFMIRVKGGENKQ